MSKPDDLDLLALHRPQFAAAGIPPAKWAPLLRKLAQGTFDAGASFAFTPGDEAEDEQTLQAVLVEEAGVAADDPEAIWLVDHAWTFSVSQHPSKQLRAHPALLARMAQLVGLEEEEEEEGKKDESTLATRVMEGLWEEEEEEKDELATRVMQELWAYANMYKLSTTPSNEAVWYIMDEFGCRIGHSETPTVAMVPVYYQPEQCMYSVFWPVQDLVYGEKVTRDYLPHETDPYLRCGKLVAFFPEQPLPEPGTLAPLPPPKLQGDDAGPPVAAADETDDAGAAALRAAAQGGTPLRVYTDLMVIHETLTDPRFALLDTEEEADVYWATPHIRSFQHFVETHPHAQIVGQLPNQKRLVCKDLLLETCCTRDTTGNAAKHLPLSYNLEISLHDFVREYRRRAAAEEDNVWILKPWNQGRSLGVVVSESLPQLLRLMETGPKVVCKYITRPVTLRAHKFDLRLYLLVRKGAPSSQAYLHKHVLCRMANEPFALRDWEDFQRHMTVFHYRTDMDTKHKLPFPEFVRAFDEEHGDRDEGAFARVWQGLEAMAADVVTAACEDDDENGEAKGMGHFGKGRALLGLDVMLEWVGEEEKRRMEPRLLEVTYAPDLRRVLQERRSFVNEVFQTLVLDEVVGEHVTRVL